jgi:hypothetical protein
MSPGLAGAHSENSVGPPSNLHTEVDDFTVFSEGDSLDKKTIDTIIFQSRTFIVFIDKNQNLYWQTNSNYEEYSDDFGAVMGRVDLLLSTPQGLLTIRQGVAFRRLIGGAIARLLDDSSSENANPILDNAEKYLRTRTTERARIWFLSSTFAIALVSALIALLLIVFHESVQRRLGTTGFAIVLATLMGSVGALLSLAWRVTKLKVDAMAGAGVHYFEGAVRAVAGMTGALVVALCVKSNILLGLVNATDNSLAFLSVLGAIAGASERLVPYTIKKVEGTLIVDGSEKE